MVYDGDGNRVAEIVGGQTKAYLVDDRNPTGYAQVVEEIVNGVVNHTYTYGHDLISQDQFDSTTGAWRASFYGYDGRGTVRFLTDETGAVTDTYTYDAFGTLITATGTTNNRYLYGGEQFDPNLGLYYLRARLMNPLTGRFWTMDSYEGAGSDPSSLHKYLYAEADPVQKTDPSGHEASVASLSAVSAIQQIVVSAAATAFVISTAADGLVQIGDFNALLYGYSQPVNNLFAQAQARAIAEGRVRIRNQALIGETYNPRVLEAKLTKYRSAETFDVDFPGKLTLIQLETLKVLNTIWIRRMMFLRNQIIDIGFDTDRGAFDDMSSPARGIFYLLEVAETRFYPFKVYDQFPPSSAMRPK